MTEAGGHESPLGDSGDCASVTSRFGNARRHVAARARDYGWFFAQALSRGIPRALKETPPSNSEEVSREQRAGDIGEVTALIIPGVYETARIFRYLRSELAGYGITTESVPGLGIMRKPVPDLAQAVLRKARDIDGPTILLAHSKGGLVGARALALAMGADTQSREDGQISGLLGMIGIAVPWYGSALALTMPGTAVWAMRPGGRAVRAAVIRSRQRQVAQRVVSLQPAWDPHIPGAHPPPGTHRIDLPSSGHFAPLGQKSTVDAIVKGVEFLAQTASGK